MAFIDARLSDRVAYGFVGGPEWSTEIVRMDNGRDQRNAQWMFPKHLFSAEYLNFTEDLRDEVQTMFYVARGQAHVFRMRNHNNYEGVDQPFAQIGGVWRMVKQHVIGGQSAMQLVQAPREGTISLSGGLLANLDLETGIYDGDASAVLWTGEFDLWVRFMSDYNAFVINSLNAHTVDIELIEVRR
jgi:uncharacterized protein (TIGR02217 family)